jgi:uncharacterized protein (DUF885 family)
MEALAYHEEFRASYAIGNSALQRIFHCLRKFGGYTAYTEGWGLYSNSFKDGSTQILFDFGRLAMEIMESTSISCGHRNTRQKWTREEE